MVRKLIDYVIKEESGILITYSKDGTKSSVFHLNHVSYSPQYGKNFIVGYCYEYDSELTFKVGRIINAEIEWIDVLKLDNYCSQEGLYITANRGDMCLGFRMKDYKKEEWLSYITDIFYRDDDVLAFHYIPYYSEGSDSKWTPFLQEDKELPKGIYVFAFTMVDGIVIKKMKNMILYGVTLSIMIYITASLMNSLKCPSKTLKSQRTLMCSRTITAHSTMRLTILIIGIWLERWD